MTQQLRRLRVSVVNIALTLSVRRVAILCMMSPQDSPNVPRADGESQTLRALAEMRELLIRGEFKPGERIKEIPLAARLGVSRTPLRLVLDRLEPVSYTHLRQGLALRFGFVLSGDALAHRLD